MILPCLQGYRIQTRRSFDVPEGDNGKLCGPALGSSRAFPGQDLDVLGVGLLNMPGPGKKYAGQPEDLARLYYYDDVIHYSGGTSGTSSSSATPFNLPRTVQ